MPNKLKHYSNQGGFSLMEILIALVILALAFSAVFLTLTSTTRNLLTLQDKTAATWVGLNQIAKIRAQLLPISENLAGKESMLEQNWLWQARFQKTDSPEILKIELQVYKSDQRSRLAAQLFGYVFNEKTK